MSTPPVPKTKLQRKREAKRLAAEEAKKAYRETVLKDEFLIDAYRMGPGSSMGWSGNTISVMAGELLRLRGLDPDLEVQKFLGK